MIMISIIIISSSSSNSSSSSSIAIGPTPRRAAVPQAENLDKSKYEHCYYYC